MPMRNGNHSDLGELGSSKKKSPWLTVLIFVILFFFAIYTAWVAFGVTSWIANTSLMGGSEMVKMEDDVRLHFRQLLASQSYLRKKTYKHGSNAKTVFIDTDKDTIKLTWPIVINGQETLDVIFHCKRNMDASKCEVRSDKFEVKIDRT